MGCKLSICKRKKREHKYQPESSLSPSLELELMQMFENKKPCTKLGLLKRNTQQTSLFNLSSRKSKETVTCLAIHTVESNHSHAILLTSSSTGGCSLHYRTSQSFSSSSPSSEEFQVVPAILTDFSGVITAFSSGVNPATLISTLTNHNNFNTFLSSLQKGGFFWSGIGRNRFYQIILRTYVMSYTELEDGYKGIMNSNYTFFSNLYSFPDYLHPRGSMAEIEDDSEETFEEKQVVVGICAMAKKSESKPMKEILTRLEDFEYIRTTIFPEETILKEPVEDWPICDCLISFHSKGFPLEKTMNYAAKQNPFIINNIDMQFELQDRRMVYSILEREGIMIPRYAVLDRDSQDTTLHELIESEDHIEVNGTVFYKPFVEKPVSAEDHNIYIYYPTSAGGGSQRLFRKIGSRSSVYSPESRVRKTGSFIYEDFMPTDGTDVKVYTVGPDYAHAEARKSPALDGKVERDSEGKEIRYPVILSAAEKLVARKVCLAFKQTVCGFDLLRANGKSYVCDVNGFSFVKNSNKYYDDCARILGNMILRELAPTLHIPWAMPFQLDDPPIVPTTFGKMMELRCVVGVIRHGDRTPKQKMKMEIRHAKFFELFQKYGGTPEKNVKLKRPKQLQEVLDIARSLLSEASPAIDSEVEEKRGKLDQLKSVLEMYGYFSGINRKVQLKYQPKGRPRASSSDDETPKEPSLVLILKWGGELTPCGRVQAEELGRIFRCEYSGTQGLGLLRLHSTFRHDLKIYASDEGRVQMTAAAFAKGLLALEGELTPILVQMVKSAHTNGLLDNNCESSKFQRQVKQKLHEMMQQDKDLDEEDIEKINPCKSISITTALKFIKNPFKCCQKVLEIINKLVILVQGKRDDPKTKDATLYHGESWKAIAARWGKLEKDFQNKGNFDISKIPDIYDCIKYDIQHNLHAIGFDQAEELYTYSKSLADVIIPQEYGLTQMDKLIIGQGICAPLLRKIRTDLQRNIEESDESNDESVNRLDPSYSHGVLSPGRHVRTRLYFTSESHIHSLLTMIRYGGLVGSGEENVSKDQDEQWSRAMEYVSTVSELNYLTQIVIMLYEDPTKDPTSEERFHIELHFSPGVNCCVQKDLPPGPGFRPNSRSDSTSKPEGDKEGKGDGPIILAKTSYSDTEFLIRKSERDNSTEPCSRPILVREQNFRIPKNSPASLIPGMDSPLTRKPNLKAYTQSPGTSLFSTAVITGYSSSDSCVKAQYDVLKGGKFPTIRSLETLHNALSLKQLDSFLDRILTVNYRPTPSLTPSSALPLLAIDTDMTMVRRISPASSIGWSGYMSSGPSSPLYNSNMDFPVLFDESQQNAVAQEESQQNAVSQEESQQNAVSQDESQQNAVSHDESQQNAVSHDEPPISNCEPETAPASQENISNDATGSNKLPILSKDSSLDEE